MNIGVTGDRLRLKKKVQSKIRGVPINSKTSRGFYEKYKKYEV